MFSRTRQNAGFSLFELLVVLILLALLAGIAAPATGRFLDTLNFRKQTAQLLASLRYARLMAISKGREVHVALGEADDGTLTFSGAVSETRAFDLGENASFTMEPGTIVFYPDGLATPARLLSRKGTRVQEIILNPLTALPAMGS